MGAVFPAFAVIRQRQGDARNGSRSNRLRNRRRIAGAFALANRGAALGGAGFPASTADHPFHILAGIEGPVGSTGGLSR